MSPPPGSLRLTPTQGRARPPPCLGLEAEDGDNDGHDGSDEHGNQDSTGLVHAADRRDNRVTPRLATLHGPNPRQGPHCPQSQGTTVSPQLPAASHWSQPRRGGQEGPQLLSPQSPQGLPGYCPCHKPHGQRLRERRKVGSAGQVAPWGTAVPVCPPPAHTSPHPSCQVPPHRPWPTHEDAQQDDVPGEASPGDKIGGREVSG